MSSGGAVVSGPRVESTRSTDHRLHERVAAVIGDRAVEDGPAVAQDLHPIGDLPHLVEPMGDVDDGHAAVAQPPDGLEEPVGLARRQRGGRLVEDQAAGLARERPGDLDDLTFADPQRCRPVGRGRCPTPGVPSTPTACAAGGRQSTRPRRVGQRPRQMFSVTVSGGASLSSWKTIEIPASRACGGRGAGDVVAGEGDPPGVRCVVADEDLHQRRFAGSVLAQERENGAASRLSGRRREGPRRR